jgi:hypothetical protein
MVCVAAFLQAAERGLLGALKHAGREFPRSAPICVWFVYGCVQEGGGGGEGRQGDLNQDDAMNAEFFAQACRFLCHAPSPDLSRRERGQAVLEAICVWFVYGCVGAVCGCVRRAQW